MVQTAHSNASPVTLLAKLCFEKSARLAELEHCSIACVRAKMGEFYGDAARDGVLVYNLNPLDADELQLLDDGDVALAKKVAKEPVKITAKRAAPDDDDDADESVVEVAEAPADDGRSAFEHASGALGNFGLEAPPSQVKALLKALELRPRRLVKCGLAPPHSLKRTPEDEDAEEAKDDAFEMVDSLSLEDKEEDEALPVAAEVVDEPAAGPDAVVSALASRGVTLLPSTLHTLLRLIDVHPRRFVKLGLVDDIQAARRAYRAGGGDAAKALFKGRGGKGGKGWGRGLHGRGAGGRGRGRGWEFGADEGCRKKHKGWAGSSSGSWGDARDGGHWNSTWGGPHGSHSWGATTARGAKTNWGTPPPGVPHEPLSDDRAPPPPWAPAGMPPYGHPALGPPHGPPHPPPPPPHHRGGWGGGGGGWGGGHGGGWGGGWGGEGSGGGWRGGGGKKGGW